jgi:DNA-binding MarR family transcriptional regulator
MLLDRQLKKEDITASQYTYILVICENPGVSQEQISEMLKIDKGSVARTIKQFAKEEYITRMVSQEDRRQYCIYPTEKAREIYTKIQGLAVQSESRLVQNFTDIEREILKNLLDKVIGNICT